MTNKYFQCRIKLISLLLFASPHVVKAQTEISSQCFDAIHDASYAVSLQQVRISVASFEAAGCDQSLNTAYKTSGGVPPKGSVNTRALLAIAYASAKRRSVMQVPPNNGIVTSVLAPGVLPGGAVVFRVPPDLEKILGGNAVFMPSNKLTKEMIVELKKSGAFAAQK
jgi:hypothetical protein